MDENELEKIDELLFEEVERRFGKLFKMILARKKRLKEFFYSMVRAFVRCLYYTKGEIFIKDLAAITRAEANYITEVPFMTFYSYAQMQMSETIENLMDNEIHRWMLLLAEKNKLPPGSVYHRFMGKFVNN